jgi:DNA-binding NtrC family response regulator
MEVKKKILVVDDEPAVTYTLSTFLNRLGHGFEMIRAFNANEASAMIKSKQPEVVLLDIDLGGIDSGMAILDMVNKQYKDKVKVIVVTGRAKARRQEIERMGCFAFIEKPVILTQLRDKVKEALGIEKIIEEKEPVVLTALPKAKLLFIEPNIHIYSYLCSIFDMKEMLNGAEYTVKIMDEITGILTVLMEYQPDIVLIGDYFMRDEELMELIDLILKDIKIKPSSIIVHGLFERHDALEAKLKKKGIVHCIQNVMDHEQLMEMNKRLLETVEQECMKHELIKK